MMIIAIEKNCKKIEYFAGAQADHNFKSSSQRMQ